MAAPKEARYSLSGSVSRSPTKLDGPRRQSTVDTATSSGAARRPTSALPDRPEERVKVFVRIRPTKAEGETGGAVRAKTGSKGLVIFREHANIPASEFEFDKVLGPSASQSDVYHAAVKPIVEDVLNGYNGTLMAYGQTGAGKTYSLSSIAADAIGMIPRAAAEVFSHIEQDGGHEYSVYMSYVQLYMELIQDLLRPESENLQIRENEGGVFVGGVHQQEVQNITQCLHLLSLGDRNRTTAFTALNAHSSRSHAVVMLTVIKRRSVSGTGEAEIQRVKVGKLFLVDLAGSERLKKSKSTGLRANEAKSINLSLTTLGMCINARADPNAAHVPFRDSKLTRLLQDSLGGNAKTSLLVAACDAAEHVDETLQSLQFGLRAMCVRTQAVVNERVDYKTLHAEMIAALENQDRKSSLLEASLLEKDAQLESVQSQLQQEQQEAARQLEALQREREALEIERLRLLAEQQATLAAEEQQKQQLLQQLQATSQEAHGLAQQHEQQRQQLLAQVAAHRQQLDEAATAAEDVAAQHRAELEQQQQAHAAEMVAAAAAREEAAAVAAAAQTAELQAVRSELEQTQKLLRGSREEARMLSQHHEQQLQEQEEEWAGKVETVEAAAARQVAAIQATIAARDSSISELQADVQARDQGIAQLHELVASLEAGKAELARQLAVATAQLEAAGRLRLQLERGFAEERELVAALQTQVEGYERSRMALAKSFFENKRSSDAAKVIQRHWREHRLQRMRQQQTEGYHALTNAKAMLGTLAQQHADLEQRRRANLAFSGQTLVGDNLDVLQDAVESVIAAFLLPARDLRTIQRYQQKVSATRQSTAYPGGATAAAAAAHGPLGGGGGGGSLSRTSTGTGADLIKASLYPLADSAPGSAYSTPREMGPGGGEGPPAAAQQQQQQYQALYRGPSSAALYIKLQQQQQQQQQQQRGGYAPQQSFQQAQQHAQQQQAHAPLLREGSLRGGLANLSAKVLAGVHSPMDRLRRLSSGTYAQQQAAAQQAAQQQALLPPQMPLQAARQLY